MAMAIARPSAAFAAEVVFQRQTFHTLLEERRTSV